VNEYPLSVLDRVSYPADCLGHTGQIEWIGKHRQTGIEKGVELAGCLDPPVDYRLRKRD
jgi:hypothetical protein